MSMMGVSQLGLCSYPYDKHQTLGELNPTPARQGIYQKAESSKIMKYK